MLAGPAPSSLPFSNSRAFLTSWTIWTDHFGDKDFPFALVLPSVFFFVAIGRSKIGECSLDPTICLTGTLFVSASLGLGVVSSSIPQDGGHENNGVDSACSRPMAA
jgi:hypothetical protein